MSQQVDVAIIGGGPVGASLALALRDSGLDVCVLEARSASTSSSDARALALSYGSRLLLERLGIWQSLHGVSPIRTIHISQQHSFGRTLLCSEELSVPELGYVMPYTALQNTLTHGLQHSGVTTVFGASVTSLKSDTDAASIHYRQAEVEHILRARLAVVADGGKLLAQQFPPEMHDYGQSALITHVACTSPRTDMAFERFTPQGPAALLPFHQGYELVWTAAHERAQEMLGWDDATFLRELQHHFGDRVGDFTQVAKRTVFPLGLKRAPNITPMPHTILLGNAAQTLHPVAGQGFNMGLRDAWELGLAILDAAPESLGSVAMLKAYRDSRRIDRNMGIRFTDSLVKFFSNELPVVSTGRAVALSALDCLPFAKRLVARRMMFGANG